MTVCKLIPHGWPCSVEECPPGFFAYMYGDDHNCIGFKDEYGYEQKEGLITTWLARAYNDAGEYIHAEGLEVQPLEVSWEEE